MKELGMTNYHVRPFDLRGLQGISDRQIEVHLELYAGYVRNTNALNADLAELVRGGKAGTPAFSELTRRLGFEYNGMRLHELYFENLTAKFRPPNESAPLHRVLTQHFRTFDAWRRDFTAVAGMRGVGWVILYEDPETKRVSNHWITLHEHGHPAGFRPLLVLDVWEHAFMVDHKPVERAAYVEAFFANVCWPVVEGRFLDEAAELRRTAGATHGR